MQARQVKMQKAGLGAGPRALHGAVDAVELPGVDDGGEVSFGPDDGVRLVRRQKCESEPDPVAKWTVTVTAVQLYLSNLSGEDVVVELTERIPVSETAYVKVALREKECRPPPKVDEDGFCTWKLELPARGHRRVQFAWRQATAPGVRGV